MKMEHYCIAVSVLIILGIGIQGLNQNEFEKKDKKIEQLEGHIEGLYSMEAERIVREQEKRIALTSPMQEYVLTSGCGIRKDPMGGGTENLHNGIDMVGPHKAPVKAAAAGTVVDHWLSPGWHDGMLYEGHPVYGCMVVIDHGNGVFTRYGHLKDSFVHIGEEVRRGQVIGIQGNTGISSGEHLHFEVILDPEVALTAGVLKE